MFEGKHIHFSPTDNKPLCSYSGKLCRQRRLNGYAFCIRHILEDKSAPFKQCSYVTRNNSQKCLNAIPTSQDRGYCHSHCQVIGIIPKTERKSKANAANKSDNSNGSLSSSGSDKSSPSSGNSVKKDPGAVFKFEEDSSDTTDVFRYKNSSANLATISNKSRSSKGKDNSVQKEGKNVKSTNTFNGTSATFTTKKITDKNKNVYTAIIPNNKGLAHLKVKNGGSIEDLPSDATQHRPFSRVGQLAGLRNQKDVIRGELNKLDDTEIRQFEQLKTLKQLDKSTLLANAISHENGEDAKLKSFPRLASIDISGESSDTSQGAVSPLFASTNFKSEDSSSPGYQTKSESPRASPSLTTPAARNTNGLSLKDEPEEVSRNDDFVEGGGENSQNQLSSNPSSVNTEDSNISSSNNNNYSNSIVYRDLKTRHEFLAQVRNSFKSQYKSIKKACQVSETCEENTKQKFRDSLVRCVKIDSSICAQVLSGYGLKFPPLYSTIKIEVETTKDSTKSEYDDYEFFDNDGATSESSTKAPTAMVDQKSKKINSKRSTEGKEVNGKAGADEGGAYNDKGSQRRFNFSAIKGKNQESVIINAELPNVKIVNGINPTSKNVKHNKRPEKRPTEIATVNEFTKSKPSTTTSSKKRLKRSDAIHSTDSSTAKSIVLNGFIKDERGESIPTVSTKSLTEVTDASGKKRRLELGGVAAVGHDLGISLNGQSSPSSSSSSFVLGDRTSNSTGTDVGLMVKCEKMVHQRNHSSNHSANLSVANDIHHDLRDMLVHTKAPSSVPSHRNQGLETVLNSVGSSDTADGVITDASFDSTFEHSTSSQPECEFSEDDLEQSFELIDPEIESQASRLLEDNVLTEADFTELFPDNRMNDHKFGRNDLQELGMAGLEFDVNDIDYSLFANIFPNFPRTSQPESISISNQF